MEQIHYGRKDINVPQSWQEMSAKQLLALARLSAAGISAQCIKLLFAFHVIGACVLRRKSDGTYILLRGFRRFVLSAGDCTLLAEKFAWLFSEEKDSEGRTVMTLVPQFVNCPWNRIGHLNGPGDFFDRLTYYQYMFLLHYESTISDRPEDSDRLLACLWHSGEVFDSNTIEHDRRRIARMSSERRIVMLWYYIGCKNALHKRYPRIFAAAGEGGTGNVFEDQMRVVDALAGGDMTKKDLVRSGYLYDALVSMDESVRRSEEMEVSMKKK